MPQLPHGLQVFPQRPEPHQHSTPYSHRRTGQVRILLPKHTLFHRHLDRCDWVLVIYSLTCLYLFFLLFSRMIYKCVMCDTVFTQKPLLYTHFDTHLAKQKVHVFKCPDCTKLYAQKGSMMEHIKVHFLISSHSDILVLLAFCLYVLPIHCLLW